VHIASLGSGSRGNATLLATAQTRIMIDCGFSLREIERRAARRRFQLSSLDALLVTHEHSDHVSGIAALARRYDLPVYLTHGTALAAGLSELPSLELRCFDADSRFRIGDIDILTVAVPHDAREPVQYRCSSTDGCVGVLTDLGCITPHVLSAFASCDMLVLEFNHDRGLLRDGPYPPALQRRVGGDWGHLSNAQAVEMLAGIDRARLQHLVVAHTSEKNNSREHVLALLRDRVPELLPRLSWAGQERGFAWLSLVPRAREDTGVASVAIEGSGV